MNKSIEMICSKRAKRKTNRNDSFMYLLNIYLLSTYYLPGTVLGPRDLLLLSHELLLSGDDRQIIKINTM